MSNVRYDKTGWDATVRELWNCGMSQKEIADVLGTTQMTVSRFVKRLGISVTNARIRNVSSMMRESMKRVRNAEAFAEAMSRRNNDLEHLLNKALCRVRELEKKARR